MSFSELFYRIITKMASTECQTGVIMFKNRANDGKANICGRNIAKYRMEMNPKMSQRALADKLQILGLDVDKNAIQRIECGKRFVTDIELVAFSQALEIDILMLLK